MPNRELIYDNGKSVKIYRAGDKAIKVFSGAPYKRVAETARIQAFACNAGLPVPAVYGVRRIGLTKVALEMAHVKGRLLISDKMDGDQTKNAIIEMARLHSMICAVDGGGFPCFSRHIAREIKKSPHLTEAAKESLLALMRRLDTGKTNLCHGDMHPANIMFDGEKYWIIDWSRSSVSKGDPAADACNTYLYQLRFMPDYAEVYLHSFCEMAGTRRKDVLAWLPVVAGYQVNIKDDEERKFILNIIDGWLGNQ